LESLGLEDYNIVYFLLNKHSKLFTKKHFKERLRGHPDYPTVLALVEVMNEFGLKAEGVQGKIEDLLEEGFPGLVLLKNGKYLILKDMDNGRINLSSGRRKIILSYSNFKKIWTGVLIRISIKPNTGYFDYPSIKNHQILIKVRELSGKLILPLIALWFLFLSYSQLGASNVIHYISALNFFGLLLSFIISLAEMGERKFLIKICPSGKLINCNKVMQSPASKVLGISLADVGVLFFSSSTLYILLSLFFNLDSGWIYLLSFLILFSIPFSLFFISYQAFVLRAFCWLCLLIQGILWSELFIFFTNSIFYFSHVDWIHILLFLFSLIIVIFVWINLKHLIITVLSYQSLKSRFLRIKQSPEYINSCLNGIKKQPIEQFFGEIVIGSNNAEMTLTLIINPLCPHCGKVLEDIKKLVFLSDDRIKGIVRFMLYPINGNNSPADELKRIDYKVSKSVLAIWLAGSHKEALECLSLWYQIKTRKPEKRLQQWEKKIDPYIPHQVNNDKIDRLLKQYWEWAKKIKIGRTPFVFILNKKLPPGLDIMDLVYWIQRVPV